MQAEWPLHPILVGLRPYRPKISPEQAKKEIWLAVDISCHVSGLHPNALEMVWYSEKEHSYFVLFRGQRLYGWTRQSIVRRLR